jgi:hypothetical protein
MIFASSLFPLCIPPFLIFGTIKLIIWSDGNVEWPKSFFGNVIKLNEAKPVKNITSMMSDSKLLLNFDAKISYYLGKWQSMPACYCF